MLSFLQLGKYGRLGNQLFQIAATIGFGEKYNCETIFPDYEYSRYFNLNIKPYDELKRLQWKDIPEQSFTYNDILVNPNINTNLLGYFQSEKYFVNYMDKIYRTFINPQTTIKREELKKIHNITNDNNICALHIRRGDYLNLPNHYINLGKIEYPYYDIACKKIKKEGGKTFLIFSDDKSWCEKWIHESDEYKHTNINNSPIDDLLLMSACNFHITANSSFSWWGSWLANSKLTIAPKQWFGPAITHDTKDLYHDRMILI